MPSYEFTGPDPRYYPEGRDASGEHLGNVEPGDIRILDEPPADGQWTPVIPPGGGDGGTGNESGGQDPGAEDEDPAEPHDGSPPGPQPAAPAVIPQ